MLLRSLVCTFAFTALALGCTANEPGPSAPDEKGCTQNAAKNEEGGFCVGLADGQSTSPTQTSPGTYEYAGTNGAVQVSVKPADQAAFDAAKKELADKAAAMGGGSRGSGTQFAGSWRETDGRTTSVVLLGANGKLYECRVTSKNAPTLQTCQTLRAL